MNDKYVDVSKACSGTYRVGLDPRLQELLQDLRLQELLQDHKSTWEANAKGGEPNHWEERK